MTKTQATNLVAAYTSKFDCCARSIDRGWVVTFYKRSYGIGVDCHTPAEVSDTIEAGGLITR